MVTRLNVPYGEKSLAQRLGALWDPKASTWFVPEGVDLAPLSRWMPRNVKLFIDPIPETAFFTNMRSELTASEWDAVKKVVFTRAVYRCEVCLGKGPKHPVECHERWDFNVETGVQRLIDLIALCPACHESTHMGLADLRGRKMQAMNHLQKVTGMTPSQAHQHHVDAMKRWKYLSGFNWKLDGSLLLSYADLTPETMEKIILNTEPQQWELVPDDLKYPFVFMTAEQKLNEVA